MRLGVNLSGHENAGARLGWDYFLPDEPTLRYFAAKGLTDVRLPIGWSRLQPVAFGPLDPAKVNELLDFLRLADRCGIRVQADLHCYGRKAVNGVTAVLGSVALAASALPGFWKPFVQTFKGRFAGYGLSNEPHDMPSAAIWPSAAQTTIWAIRKLDDATPIYVCGDNWASAAGWSLKQPYAGGNIINEAHLYFDKDGSGTYKLPFDQDGATVKRALDRLAVFVAWLRKTGQRGYIGEYGCPPGAEWLPILDTFVQAVFDASDVLIGADYWAAGYAMQDYALTIQPAADGKWIDRPQMAILTKARR